MKNPEKVRAELKIVITYDCNGSTEAEIKHRLEQAVTFLSGEGQLSGELDATVNTWDSLVTTKVVK